MSEHRFQGLFVTGTDTGVGKSIVTGGLVGWLRKQGVKVGVMKPVETGCLHDDGSFLPADAQFLKDISGVDTRLEVIVPYQFKEPLAPAVAAEREGAAIDCDELVKKFEALCRSHDFVFVEGAGGLMVPLDEKFLFIDLIKRFQIPVLIVSRATLGTINHTVLTVRAAQAEGLRLGGIVINNLSPGTDVAAETNPEVIARLVDVPVWGVVPYREGLTPTAACRQAIIGLVEEHLHVEHLLNLMQP